MEKQVLARRDAHALTSDALSRGTWEHLELGAAGHNRMMVVCPGPTAARSLPKWQNGGGTVNQCVCLKRFT